MLIISNIRDFSNLGASTNATDQTILYAIKHYQSPFVRNGEPGEAICLTSHSLAILELRITRVSTRSHVMKSRLEMNNEDVASILPKLVESYSVKDVFTMDVTKLAFRRSLVAYERSTEIFPKLKMVLSMPNLQKS